MQIGPTDVGAIAAYVRQNRRGNDWLASVPPFIFVGDDASAVNLRARVIDRIGEFSCFMTAALEPVGLKYATLVVAVEKRGLTVVKAR